MTIGGILGKTKGFMKKLPAGSGFGAQLDWRLFWKHACQAGVKKRPAHSSRASKAFSKVLMTANMVSPR